MATGKAMPRMHFQTIARELCSAEQTAARRTYRQDPRPRRKPGTLQPLATLSTTAVVRKYEIASHPKVDISQPFAFGHVSIRYLLIFNRPGTRPAHGTHKESSCVYS
jgi:hypothetical protein